jgi:biotin-dependent carboxylase-like uncharacterized protein
MSALLVRSCGPGASIQDRGRFGWQRYGIGPAGAMDPLSSALANALAGNPGDAAVIELAVAGAKFEAQGGTMRIAVVGAAQDVAVGGRKVPPLTTATAHEGELIEIGPARAGLFSYLAVLGGIDTPPQLGSRALHMRAGLGGLGGNALSPGARVPAGGVAPKGAERSLPNPLSHAAGAIRVVMGPQDDYFTKSAIDTLASATYTVTPQADRMGIRLAGPRLEHSALGYNIVSDGIGTGSIQVPGAGEPLILLADRQTTGGYPKIATVITADLPRLAQSPPGTGLRFQIVGVEQAIAILRAQRLALEAAIVSITEAGSAELSSDRLLGLNLLSGWVDAKE